MASVREEALRTARESQEQLREMVVREQCEAQEFLPRMLEREQQVAREQPRLMMGASGVHKDVGGVPSSIRSSRGPCRWNRPRSTISVKLPVAELLAVSRHRATALTDVVRPRT
jgi:hypothetical protein